MGKIVSEYTDENKMPTHTNVSEYAFFTEKECVEVKDYCIGIEKILIKEGHDKTTGHESLGNVITTNNYFHSVILVVYHFHFL